MAIRQKHVRRVVHFVEALIFGIPDEGGHLQLLEKFEKKK